MTPLWAGILIGASPTLLVMLVVSGDSFVTRLISRHVARALNDVHDAEPTRWRPGRRG